MAEQSASGCRVISSVKQEVAGQSNSTSPSPTGRTFCPTRRKSTPPVHKRYTPFHAMLGASGSHDDGAVARDINANVMVVPSKEHDFVMKADVHSLECSQLGDEDNNNIVVKGSLSSFKQLGASFLDLLPSDDIEVLGSWEVDNDEQSDHSGCAEREETRSKGTPEKPGPEQSTHTGKGKTSPRAPAKNTKEHKARVPRTTGEKQKSSKSSTVQVSERSMEVSTKIFSNERQRRSRREKVPKKIDDIVILQPGELNRLREKKTKQSASKVTVPTQLAPSSEQEAPTGQVNDQDHTTSVPVAVLSSKESLVEPVKVESKKSKIKKINSTRSSKKRTLSESTPSDVQDVKGKKKTIKEVSERQGVDSNSELEPLTNISLIGEVVKKSDSEMAKSLKQSGRKRIKKQTRGKIRKKIRPTEEQSGSENEQVSGDKAANAVTMATDEEQAGAKGSEAMVTAESSMPREKIEKQQDGDKGPRKSKRISIIKRYIEDDIDEDGNDKVFERRVASPKGSVKVKNEVHSCKHCTYSTIFRSRLKVHTRMHTGERPFSCKKCKKSFAQRSALVVHERFHSDSRPYVCNVCQRGFHTSGHLHDHSRIHSGERPFICVKCRKTFRISSHLQIHLRIHNNERLYKCDVCPKSFIQSSQLKVHQKIHNRDVEAKHACNKCDKKFLLQWNLNLHKRTVHSHGHKPFQCDDCGKSFTVRNYLVKHRKHCQLDPADRRTNCPVCNKDLSKVSRKRHLMLHTDSKKYVCDVCSKAFRFSHSLLTHVRVHTKDAPSDCPICKMSLADFNGLRKHYKKVHKLDPWEKNFKCSMCSHSFFSKMMLARHLSEVHTERRPHQCSQCGKAFKTERNLRQHRNVHNAESYFRCDQCPQSFSQRGNLKVHIATVHEKVKNYKCDTCEMTFASKRNLGNHMHTHTGEKPHECSQCHLRFSQRGTLKRHERVHLDLRPFTCDVCQKGFRQKVHLVTHMKMHGKLSCDLCELQCKTTGELRDHMRKLHGDTVTCVKCSVAMEPKLVKGKPICQKCRAGDVADTKDAKSPRKRRNEKQKDGSISEENSRRKKSPPSTEMVQSVSSRKTKVNRMTEKSAPGIKSTSSKVDVKQSTNRKASKSGRVKTPTKIKNIDSGTQTEAKTKNTRRKKREKTNQDSQLGSARDTCYDSLAITTAISNHGDQQTGSPARVPGDDSQITSTNAESQKNQVTSMDITGGGDGNTIEIISSKVDKNQNEAGLYGDKASLSRGLDPSPIAGQPPADTVDYRSQVIDLSTKSPEKKPGASLPSPASGADTFSYSNIIVIKPVDCSSETGSQHAMLP